MLDAAGCCQFANATAARLLDLAPERLAGQPLAPALPPSLAAPFAAACAEALAGRDPPAMEQFDQARGRWIALHVAATPAGLVLRLSDISARKRAEALAEGQRRTLELVALGAPLRETLDTLLRVLEGQSRDMLCSILLLEPGGGLMRHGAAPSLPEAFVAAIDGRAIGPQAGSCGTAAYRRAPVMVEDIATDPLWEAYRAVALPFGLRACWSTPIFGTGGEVLGTFAIYYRHPGRPTPEHLEIIRIATHLAAIAIGRERTEGALLRSEARLSDIIRKAINAVVVFGSDRRILLFNDAAAAMFRMPSADAVGQEVTAFVPGFTGTKAGGAAADLRGRRADGEEFPLEVSVSRIESMGETISTAILHDVSERQRQAREIERLNRLYAVLSRVSQAIVRLRSEAALLPEICRAIVEHGDLRLAWIGRHDPVTATLRPVAQWGDQGEYLADVCVRTDGSPESGGPTGRAFRTGGAAVCNDFFAEPATSPWWERAARHGIAASAAFPIHRRGAPWGTITIYAGEAGYFQPREVALLQEAADEVSFALEMFAQDDDRHAAEDRAMRLAAIVESSEDAIISTTIDGAVTSWNPAAERMFGFTAAEAVGRNADMIVPPEAAGELPAILTRIGTGERVRNFETMRLRRDGATFPCSITISPILAPDRSIIGTSSIARDITVRRRDERALRELNESLEQTVASRTAELRAAMVRVEAADRAKSAFLATMSHELRTPLNSIIGFTGIILQGLAGPLNAEQAKQLTMVRGSARHLLALINDVLDISKIEAGQLDIHPEPLDLPAAIAQAVASVRPQAVDKGIALHVAVPGTPPMVSDRKRVQQILLNLLSNAVKFTQAGTVTLSAEAIEEWLPPGAAARCRAVRIRVADTGIGIRADDLPKLFQPFRQVDSSLTRLHEGTGLGLAICHRLVGMLGGEIAVSSDWGRGSVFTVTLPTHPRPIHPTGNA